MGPAETAGIVVVTVAIIQGLTSLVKFAIEKLNKKDENSTDNVLKNIQEKIGEECGLNEKQGGQLHTVYEIVTQKDAEGMPLVYFPRQSMGETQKEIAARLERVTETQLKILAIIERIERRQETS